MKRTTRQLQKEETRQKLIRAAYAEFEKRGILATRMSDVAAAAEVSHGTVFVHFETQEALICAVIEHYCGLIALRTHQLAEQCASVRDILAAQLSCIAEFEPFYRRLILEKTLLPPAAQASLLSIQSAAAFHLSLSLEREIAAGKVVDEPVALLFNTWTGLVHYYLANKDLFAPEGKVLRRYGDILLKHYLRLITTDKT